MTVGVIDYQTMKQDCMALTAWFETSQSAPTCFGVTGGDWDGQGLSWGAIQYNLGQGTLQPIWKYLYENYYNDSLTAFNNDKGSLDYVYNLITKHTVSDQISWGNSITDWSSTVNGHGVVEPWKTYFSQWGQLQEAINKQTDNANWYFQQAEAWKPLLSVWSRRGYALLFDIAVQKGSFPQGCIDQVNADMSAYDTTGLSREQIETYRLQRIANRRTYYGDISTTAQSAFLQRKTAIANGSGVVYGSNFDTVPYDAILEPAYQSDVAVTTTTTTTSTTQTTDPVTVTDTSTTTTNNADGSVTTTTTTTYSDGSQQTVSSTTTPLVMMKSFPISIDMESGVDKDIVSPFNQDDLNTIEISFSFTQDRTVFDLTGLTPTLIVKKPDGTILQLTNITITDVTNGHCNIVLPSNANDQLGQYWCEIRLVDNVGSRLISEPFDYMVNEGFLHGTNSQATNTMQTAHNKFFN